MCRQWTTKFLGTGRTCKAVSWWPSCWVTLEIRLCTSSNLFSGVGFPKVFLLKNSFRRFQLFSLAPLRCKLVTLHAYYCAVQHPWSTEWRIPGSRFPVPGFRALGSWSRSRVPGSRFRVPGFGFRVPAFGFPVHFRLQTH